MPRYANTQGRASLMGGTFLAITIIPLGVRALFSHAHSPNVLILGNVTFVDQATGSAKNLAYVNDAGNAILRVDNSTDITGTGLVYRDSVGQQDGDVICC